MGLFNFIADIIKPASDIVDELHTSTEEKLEAKAKLLALQVEMSAKAMQYEAEIARAQADTIQAESKGESIIQRNWRPILMLFFGGIIGYVILWGGFDLKGRPIPQDYVTYVLEIVKFGVTGYVVGRSAEKIIPAAVAALKSKEQT